MIQLERNYAFMNFTPQQLYKTTDHKKGAE